MLVQGDVGNCASALKQEADGCASVISEDFGNRSRHETLLADIWPVVSSARETLKHLAGWMKPKRVGVGLELMPGRARIPISPSASSASSAPGIIRFSSLVVPLIAALGGGQSRHAQALRS